MIAREIGLDLAPVEQALARHPAFEKQFGERIALRKKELRAHRLETPLVPPPHNLGRKAIRKGCTRYGAVAPACNPVPARDRKAELDERLREKRRDDVPIEPAGRSIDKIHDPANSLDLYPLAIWHVGRSGIPRMRKWSKRKRPRRHIAFVARPACFSAATPLEDTQP